MITITYTNEDINKLYRKYINQFNTLFPISNNLLQSNPFSTRHGLSCKMQYVYSCIRIDIIYNDRRHHNADRVIVNGVNIMDIKDWNIYKLK